MSKKSHYTSMVPNAILFSIDENDVNAVGELITTFFLSGRVAQEKGTENQP